MANKSQSELKVRVKQGRSSHLFSALTVQFTFLLWHTTTGASQRAWWNFKTVDNVAVTEQGRIFCFPFKRMPCLIWSRTVLGERRAQSGQWMSESCTESFVFSKHSGACEGLYNYHTQSLMRNLYYINSRGFRFFCLYSVELPKCGAGPIIIVFSEQPNSSREAAAKKGGH